MCCFGHFLTQITHVANQSKISINCGWHTPDHFKESVCGGIITDLCKLSRSPAALKHVSGAFSPIEAGCEQLVRIDMFSGSGEVSNEKRGTYPSFSNSLLQNPHGNTHGSKQFSAARPNIKLTCTHALQGQKKAAPYKQSGVGTSTTEPIYQETMQIYCHATCLYSETSILTTFALPA